jgi:hypothetical protein
MGKTSIAPSPPFLDSRLQKSKFRANRLTKGEWAGMAFGSRSRAFPLPSLGGADIQSPP